MSWSGQLEQLNEFVGLIGNNTLNSNRSLDGVRVFAMVVPLTAAKPD